MKAVANSFFFCDVLIIGTNVSSAVGDDYTAGDFHNYTHDSGDVPRDDYQYSVFVPKDDDGKKSYPVVFYLHGGGDGRSHPNLGKRNMVSTTLRDNDRTTDAGYSRNATDFFGYILVSPVKPVATWNAMQFSRLYVATNTGYSTFKFARAESQSHVVDSLSCLHLLSTYNLATIVGVPLPFGRNPGVYERFMVRQRGRYLRLLLKVFNVLLVLLAFRVLAGMVYEYQWYFPPNFQAGFLAGRESFFHGLYGFAFYSHITCGPIAILIAMFLFWSGPRNFRIGIHRVLGKIQFLLVVTVLVPSGLVMATRAYSGAIAGAGFAFLSIMTAAAAILSVVYVKRGDLLQHRRWSTRLFILLISPIVLRVNSGFIIMLGIESYASYQFNAWASWLIPLIIFEIWQRHQLQSSERQSRQLRNESETNPQSGSGFQPQ